MRPELAFTAPVVVTAKPLSPTGVTIGRIGWARAAPVLRVPDVVEATVVKRIQQQLASEGIEAVIERVPTPGADAAGPDS